MNAAERTTLAVIEGFVKPRDYQAHGTVQAAYLICQALAQQRRYEALHVYLDRYRTAASELALPSTLPAKSFDRTALRDSTDEYAAIYVANGDQMVSAPHVLRPPHDWTPVICSVGTAHSNSQWLNLLVSRASGALRESDGFIFKSRAAERLFRSTFADWNERFASAMPFPSATTVIGNGVDVEANRRSEDLRKRMRWLLRVRDDDVLFLAFGRLSPGTKGDQQALVMRWKDVLTRLPRALLVLSGMVVDRTYVSDLRNLAAAAGVANRVRVVDNPFELAPNARTQLMSAADVFVHLTTGIEETSSLVVHEAMAHALPVITTSWAAMPEIVTHGETGFLVAARNAPLAPEIPATLFGQSDIGHGLAASKVVALDWPAFMTAVTALGNRETRAAIGAAARGRAETHALPSIAAAYVRFFDATSRAAESAWKGPTPTRPLVDLDAAISAQASGPLAAHELVRLGDTSRFALLAGGVTSEATVWLDRVFLRFRAGQPVTLGELAETIVNGPSTAGPTDPALARDYAVAGRFLVRLLNFGALELV